MALNRELIGKEYPPGTYKVTEDAIIKYALATNDDNLWYTYPRREGGIIAPPIFGVVWNHLELGKPLFDPDLKVNLLMLLHGEQDMIFKKVVKPGDTITTVSSVHHIEDKGSGEILVIKLLSKNQEGEEVLETYSTMFIRGSGSGKKKDEKKEDTKKTPKLGEPVFVQEVHVKKYQPYIYAEASGDHNPIHVDPNTAKMAGLPGVILQGLCTMAFAQNAIVNNYLGEDPRKLRRLKVRFSKPVLPGDTLKVVAWETERNEKIGKLFFEVYNQKCEKVITDGLAEAEV